MQVSKFDKFLLTFISFTSLIGSTLIPTWRLINILFVISSMFKLKKFKINKVSIQIFTFSLIFFFILLLQSLYLISKNAFDSYGFSFLIATFFLLLFTNIFFQYCLYDLDNILKTIRRSIYILFIYQIYQIFAYYFLDSSYVLVLNNPDILNTSNVFRMVGSFIGPPSFMAESGHLALFTGPFLLSCLILEKKNQLILSNKFKIICTLHLILTFSGGAFIYFIFIVLIMFFNTIKKISILLQFLFFTILVVALIYKLNPFYFELISNKFYSVLNFDSPRFEGAQVFLNIFKENFLFGLNFKSSRFLNADPNMFFPVMLADHGIIGTTSLLLLLVLPFVIMFISQRNRLISVAFLAMFLHLFFSYGTFTWPMIWINYCIMLTFGYGCLPDLKLSRL